MAEYAVEFETSAFGTAYVEAESEDLARDIITNCDSLNEILTESLHVDYDESVEVTITYPTKDTE